MNRDLKAIEIKPSKRSSKKTSAEAITIREREISERRACVALGVAIVAKSRERNCCYEEKTPYRGTSNIYEYFR